MRNLAALFTFVATLCMPVFSQTPSTRVQPSTVPPTTEGGSGGTKWGQGVIEEEFYSQLTDIVSDYGCKHVNDEKARLTTVKIDDWTGYRGSHALPGADWCLCDQLYGKNAPPVSSPEWSKYYSDAQRRHFYVCAAKYRNSKEARAASDWLVARVEQWTGREGANAGGRAHHWHVRHKEDGEELHAHGHDFQDAGPFNMTRDEALIVKVSGKNVILNYEQRNYPASQLNQAQGTPSNSGSLPIVQGGLDSSLPAGMVRFTVVNGTAYTLSVLVGETSLTIPPGDSSTTVLPSGSYSVSATVAAPNVLPLATVYSFAAGYTYSSNIFIGH